MIAVGKRHEPWLVDGIERFAQRLRTPYAVEWRLLTHSLSDGDRAREEESTRILATLNDRAFVVLLDERGTNLTSPAFSDTLSDAFNDGREVVCVIGGAYGVNEAVCARANLVWSLSRLVFPHQLVRLLVVEQLYRAQEIAKGSKYHHQ
ncbi:23S rRNA (pseudouridine(1915)-N(3))-methyltransferase RlmH [Candidatus Saccharibacteria bacterium]|nr:23S rRNA (pseudouridine(1915)-N(3))-methyltransferase RlmH [Candidatus Saccharibacteria bacterium]